MENRSSHSEELTSDSDLTHSSGSSDVDLDSSSEIETDDGSTTSASDGTGAPTPRDGVNAPAALPRLTLPVPRLDITATASEPDTKKMPFNLSPLQLGSLPQGGGSLTAGPSTPEVAVELLSPAFAVSQGPGRHMQELQGQCASKFGVRKDRVRLYALVELGNADEVPPGCRRLAVEVQGSAFSLHAMEEILQENQRLSAATAVVGSTALLEGSSQNELDRLKQEIGHLRQRLTSSELLRHRGQQALQELKEEFETLHFDLMHHSGDGTPPTAVEPALSVQTIAIHE